MKIISSPKLINNETLTVDIETSDTHTYQMKNGCISHNSTSTILGTASGIHPHHSNRYFRRIQANKLEEPLKYFRKFNPTAIEESVWSNNNTDDIITFCCEVPVGAKTKVDTDGLQLLEYVKLVQQNWVEPGKNKHLCTQPWLSHNVSNTIHVKENEWDKIGDYIYDNRKWLAGVSLLSINGDKDYPQAPFTTVYTPEQIVKEYGDGSILASGFIVDSLKYFDGDLWEACSYYLGVSEKLIPPENFNKKQLAAWARQNNYYEKLDLDRRAKQFAYRYFDNDIKKMTYCLKDVWGWKKWLDLTREYKTVPWEEFKESTDNTKVQDTVACGSGKCELTLDV